MKKIKLLISLMLVTLGLVGLASCSDDRDSNPVVTTAPTSFNVNVPVASEQYVQLSKTNTVDMSWSQPNYSFVTLAHYYVQVGLKKTGESKITWNTDKNGNNAFLETSYTKCVASLNGEEIAWAINNLDGVTTKSEYQDLGYRNIYFRVYSRLEDGQGNEVANSGIFSNEVCFKNMAAYNAVKEKGWIYIVGSVGGTGDWTTPDENATTYYSDWRLFETEIGNKVYEGTFTLKAGAQFRFYKALTGWDDDSMGSQTDDAGINIPEFAQKGVYEGDIVTASKSKGSWVLQNFEGGSVKITVNLNTNKVKFEKQ